MSDCEHDEMTDRGYVLVARPKPWVKPWLWRLILLSRLYRVTAVRGFLYEHADGECGCACHRQPGMRECAFCGWKA